MPQGRFAVAAGPRTDAVPAREFPHVLVVLPFQWAATRPHRWSAKDVVSPNLPPGARSARETAKRLALQPVYALALAPTVDPVLAHPGRPDQTLPVARHLFQTRRPGGTA